MTNPLTDPVLLLLETPFGRRDKRAKNDVLSAGKPTPGLSEASSADRKGNKKFCRSFNPNLYGLHSWLCGSHYAQKLFCWPCLLSGRTKSAWNTVGYDDFKNVARGPRIHESSKDHLTNYLALKYLEKTHLTAAAAVTNGLGDDDKKSFNEQVRLNRLLLEHAIDMALFLSRRERFGSADAAAFRELLDAHMAKCSPDVRARYRDVAFSDASLLLGGLVECVAEYASGRIRLEMRRCAFYAVQYDDAGGGTRSAFARYYDAATSELVERFLGFCGGQSDHPVLSAVRDSNAPRGKLVAQCYDGLAELENGVIEAAEPGALFTHSLDHALDSVLRRGVADDRCRLFFARLEGMMTPPPPSMSWFLRALVDNWDEFATAYSSTVRDPNARAESVCMAVAHADALRSFEFAFLACAFDDVFCAADALRDRPFDADRCLLALGAARDLIARRRNKSDLDVYLGAAAELVNRGGGGDGQSADTETYKTLFYGIVDDVVAQLATRFQNVDKLRFVRLTEEAEFAAHHVRFPECEFASLLATYSYAFRDAKKLRVELEVLYADRRYRCLEHVYDLVRIFGREGIAEIMPEAFRLFALVLALPSTGVPGLCGEHFSCLGRIKTYARNGGELSQAAVLSIEKSMIRRLGDTADSFYDDVIDLFAGKNYLAGLDLTYKT